MKFNFYSGLFTAVLFLVFFSGCGNNEPAENKSLDQIMSEEGIPVEVLELSAAPFEKYLTYFAKLSGIREATKSSMIGGKVEKIRYKVGDAVNEGAVIVEFPTDAPMLQYEQAKTAYENAKKNYERMKALLAAGETSQSNYDAVETQYLVAKRNFESQRQLLFIDAPFNGTIVDVKVSEGDFVKNETHLFTIAQLNKMRTKIWVSEKEITSFKKGMKAVIQTGNKVHTGKVVETSMAIDPYKQAFFVEIEFDNTKRELMSGVTVEIKALVYSNSDAVVIPRNLINTDNNGKFVFVNNNGSASKRYLELGQESGISVEVISGLNPGDRLIVKGGDLLDEGTKLKVIE